jgi:hypothetical protein
VCCGFSRNASIAIDDESDAETSEVFIVDNQDVTDDTLSLKTPRSYHGKRELQLDLFESSKNTCTSEDFRMNGCAAMRAINIANPARRFSIPLDDGSSICINVFEGTNGTIAPSTFALSCFPSHSKSEYLRVTHPDSLANDALFVQYEILYSICFDNPSPTRCGSLTSTCNQQSFASCAPSYAGVVTTTDGALGRGPGVSHAARSSPRAGTGATTGGGDGDGGGGDGDGDIVLNVTEWRFWCSHAFEVSHRVTRRECRTRRRCTRRHRA